ncbi:Oidioi.mRNA.OKI2018_I69.chr2.g7113.t1.cds [Oikopleura dioica]|uniref:Oidioi.mRNA.OKI2018_I69.chr2.g7113.t1.cds n=1 Tax=Oikopleura dioica TaxID=34765 RepID=A0ABN7T548_OIKDI|nr:Oidioi.mRNA.OKI2018_I69.chr2.g7113.t1.cds [Oikopleura dioica]
MVKAARSKKDGPPLVKVPENPENKPTCCFCKQPGLRDDEIPMNVDTWQEKKTLSIVARNDEVAKEKLETDPKFARPHYAPVEFQAYYGNWFKDEFSQLDDKDISCHEACLLFSPNLYIRDPEDDEKALPKDLHHQTIGGSGILREDVLKELGRARIHKCFICKKGTANVGCAHKTCRLTYHYPCAQKFGLVSVLDNQSNSSYCWRHATRKYRYPHARGQGKYCLDVELKVNKENDYELRLDYHAPMYKRLSTNTKSGFREQDFSEKGYVLLVEDFIKQRKVIETGFEIKWKNLHDLSNMTDEQKKINAQKKMLALDDEFQSYFAMKKRDERLFTCNCCGEYFSDLKDLVVAKCCKFANFHRHCLTKAGVTQGLCHFRCPLCQETQDQLFVKSCIAQGVWIPNRLPLSELDMGFDDQYEGNKTKLCSLYNKDEKKNKCKLKKDEGFDGTEEEVINCDDCGSNGVHIACNEDLLATFNEENRRRLTDPNFNAKYDYVCSVCGPAIESDGEDTLVEEPEEQAMEQDTVKTPTKKRDTSILDELEESSDEETPIMGKSNSVESTTREIRSGIGGLHMIREEDVPAPETPTKRNKRKLSSTFEAGTPTKRTKNCKSRSISSFFSKKN